MKRMIKILSFISLAITLVAPVMVWQGMLDPATNKRILAFAMLLWFATAPWWMNSNKEPKHNTG